MNKIKQLEETKIELRKLEIKLIKERIKEELGEFEIKKIRNRNRKKNRNIKTN